jgi:hypothetical protein
MPREEMACMLREEMLMQEMREEEVVLAGAISAVDVVYVGSE